MKNKLHSCLGRFKLQGLSGKKESLPTQIKSKRERVKESEEEGKKGFPLEIEEEGESTKMTQTQAQTSEVQQQQAVVQSGQLSGNLSFSSSSVTTDNEEMSKTALSTFRAKEEEIEKKKLEVRERVQLHLGRIEEETKRLATIREELETLADPMRKEVSVVRKRIDAVNKELKPLGQTCQKKEKEYKDALDAFNDKNKEKVQLITRLMELVSESERMRMKKLDELSKSIETVQ